MNNNIHDNEVHYIRKDEWTQKTLSKILLTMKLFAVLMLIACLHVKANVFSQQVSLKVKNVSLENVIKEIRKQSGYAFFYDAEYLQKAFPVTIEVKNASVEEALIRTFSGQSFTWEILEKTILIKPIVTKEEKDKKVAQPARDIKGRITDDKGEGYLVQL